MRTALAAWQQQRRKAGLARFDRAEKRAMREWRASVQGIADTRATTSFGVNLKSGLIKIDLRDSETGFSEAILASAMTDVSRMARKR